MAGTATLCAERTPMTTRKLAGGGRRTWRAAIPTRPGSDNFDCVKPSASMRKAFAFCSTRRHTMWGGWLSTPCSSPPE